MKLFDVTFTRYCQSDDSSSLWIIKAFTHRAPSNWPVYVTPCPA
jgi:hypothetical protein